VKKAMGKGEPFGEGQRERSLVDREKLKAQREGNGWDGMGRRPGMELMGPEGRKIGGK
jgi:hypothetical protein